MGGHTRSGGATADKGRCVSAARVRLAWRYVPPFAPAPRRSRRRVSGKPIAPARVRHSNRRIHQSLAWPNLGPVRTARFRRGAAVRCEIAQRCPSAQVITAIDSKADLLGQVGRIPQAASAAPSDCATRGWLSSPACQNGVTVELRRASAARFMIDKAQSRAGPSISAGMAIGFTPRSCRFRAGGQIDHAVAMSARQRRQRAIIWSGLNRPIAHAAAPRARPRHQSAAAHRGTSKDCGASFRRLHNSARPELRRDGHKAPHRCNASKTARANAASACGLDLA